MAGKYLFHQVIAKGDSRRSLWQTGCPNWLRAQIGYPQLENWRYKIYAESINNLKEMRDGYKDQWDNAYWEETVVLYYNLLFTKKIYIVILLICV